MKDVRFHRFTDVSLAVVGALAEFPAQPDWPVDLYRLLIDQVPRNRRVIFLCTKDDAPAGVLALARDNHGTWEPVTQWVLPGWMGPVQPSLLTSIASTIPIRSRFAWWRMVEPVPECGGNVRRVREEETYAIKTSADYEAYWKSTGQIRSVLKARRRCSGMKFAVNQPGAARWVITRSDELWRTAPDKPTAHMMGRIAAAEHLEPLGRHFTLTLQDVDKWVAGDTYVVHRGDLVALCTFRDRSYDHFGVGNRLLDMAFSWGRGMRFESVDLGGGYAYKVRWAPATGSKSTVLVSPLLPCMGYRARKLLSSSWSSIAKTHIGTTLNVFRSAGVKAEE